MPRGVAQLAASLGRENATSVAFGATIVELMSYSVAKSKFVDPAATNVELSPRRDT
jgi:hypothetical protein